MKKFVSIFLIFYIIFLSVSPVFAYEPKQVIRVAKFNSGNYFISEDDGTVKSYDKEYLDKISEYTGMQYEFVDCGTWQNAVKMLENHQIDLVGTMQTSDERLQNYDFCKYEYGVTYASLACLPDKDYTFQDYTSFSDASIGCTIDYVRKSELYNWMSEHNITGSLTFYDTEPQLVNALQNGEIDIMAASVHTILPEWNILDKYCFSPFYFTTWKGNSALTEMIDNAILKIKLYESEFEDSLIEYYFPYISVDPLTSEEKDYINNSNGIELFFDPEAAPITFVDKKSGNMKGVIIDNCELISHSTGLKIQYKSLVDRALIDDSKNQYAFISIVNNYTSEYTKESDNEKITKPIFEFPFYLYCNWGFDYNVNSSYTVAMTSGRPAIRDYLEHTNPNYNIIECNTIKECFDLLKEGKVDLVFSSLYTSNNILIKENRTDVNFIPTTETNIGIAIKFTGSDSEILKSIFNKEISTIKSEDQTQALLNYTTNMAPEASLSYFIQTNTGVFIFILFIIFLVLLFACIWLIRYYAISKQKAALSSINDELRKANAAKTDFLSRMSHDIRTPMNAIIGMTNLAKKSANVSEETLDYLEKINSSSNFLLGLINDILDMSKIESGSLNFNPSVYFYNDFLSNISAMFTPLCNNKNVTFIIERGLTENTALFVDKVRFNQIFFNILSNAIKYTPNGGEVKYEMKNILVNNKNLSADYIISDNGIGMSEEFQKEMFNPFAREHDDTNTTEGTGLGLAITKNILDLMGGNINVSSKEGKGTTVIIHLEIPLAAKEQIVTNKIADNLIGDLNGKKVLLVEDHPLNTEIAEKILENKGVTVVSAKNGLDGLNKFRSSDQYEFDAILMDIRMPVMDGLDTTKKIRKLNRPDAKNIPIIAMSANAYQEDIEKSLSAGINEHLAKPINPELLYATLEKFIGKNK